MSQTISGLHLHNAVKAALRSGFTRQLRTTFPRALCVRGFGSKATPAPHFRSAGSSGTYQDGQFMPHPLYTEDELNHVEITHKEPEKIGDKVAYGIMRLCRFGMDNLSGYGKHMTEEDYLKRFLFLESIAGVPGMVGGMLRHLHSLRTMERDYGWIHTLLEEAENERMHLLTFLELKKPGPAFRGLVLLAQGVFFNLYFISYLLSPRTCHRFVGYLEEEAVKTYSKCINDIETRLPQWREMPATKLSKKYWHLPEDATMEDVIKAVRADEAIHREVNHTLSELKPNEPNPFHH